jgi:tetratricopeptide (TPR) repeat protein
MGTVSRLALVAAIAVTTVSGATAQESWVGKTIITKKDGIKITYTGAGGKQVELAELKGVEFQILGDKDGQLQVNDGRGSTGWFPKCDAVLLEDAVAYFTQRIHQNPNDANALYSRAAAWELKGATDNAIKDIEEAIRLDPSARTYNGRAWIWLGKKEYDKAIADSNEALRLNPHSEGAYRNRGVALAAKEERDKATVDFTEVIRLDPKCFDAYFNRGLQWLRKKEYDKAIADHSEAIRLDSNFAIAYYCRGLAWGYKGDYDRAIADFSETVRLDRKCAHAFVLRAYAWAHTKAYGKAIADFNETVRLDPKCRDGYTGRAWIWATCPDPNNRDGKKAIESARQGLAIDPNNPWCMVIRAAAHAEIGEFAEAVRWQERALEDLNLIQYPDQSRILELYRDKRPLRQE